MVPVENNFSYPVGEWFKVEHIIDLDANTFTLKINDVLVLDEAYTGNIGGIDFYSIDANNEQYIDDVLLIELVPTTYYADTDGDTYGDPANTISVIGDAPDGYVSDTPIAMILMQPFIPEQQKCLMASTTIAIPKLTKELFLLLISLQAISMYILHRLS